MATSSPGHEPRFTTVYAALVAEWARQTRVYSRSVHLYQELTRRHAVRQVPGLVRSSRSHRIVLEGAVTRPSLAGESNDHGTAVMDLATRTADHADAAQRTMHGPLTARQLEIAALIADGLTNEEIADRLVLTRGTVGNHIGHILRRLSLKNRAQVTAWVIRRMSGQPAARSG